MNFKRLFCIVMTLLIANFNTFAAQLPPSVTTAPIAAPPPPKPSSVPAPETAGTVTSSTTTAEFDESRWDGMNLGLQAGWAWNQTDWNFNNVNYFNTLGATKLGNDFDSNSNGIVGGGYIGYMIVASPMIIGIKASFLGSDLKTSFDSPFFPTIDTFTAKIENFGSVVGRIAYPLDRWLFSLDAGWAGGTMVLTLHDHVDDVKANFSEWTNGWTIGLGVDYRLLKRLSLGVAYDFIGMTIDEAQMDCDTCGTGVGFGTPEITGRSRTHMLSARATYFLGS